MRVNDVLSAAEQWLGMVHHMAGNRKRAHFSVYLVYPPSFNKTTRLTLQTAS